jgi:hypothetical protein
VVFQEDAAVVAGDGAVGENDVAIFEASDEEFRAIHDELEPFEGAVKDFKADFVLFEIHEADIAGGVGGVGAKVVKKEGFIRLAAVFQLGILVEQFIDGMFEKDLGGADAGLPGNFGFFPGHGDKDAGQALDFFDFGIDDFSVQKINDGDALTPFRQEASGFLGLAVDLEMIREGGTAHDPFDG